MFLGGIDVPEICDKIVGAKPSTIYNWIRQENWKTTRDGKILNQQKSPDILLSHLEILLQQIQRLLDRLENSEDTDIAEKLANQIAKFSDSIVKISKTIKTLYKDQDKLSQIIFVVGELGGYMNIESHKYNEDFRVKFDILLEGFQTEMIKKYSPKNLI